MQGGISLHHLLWKGDNMKAKRKEDVTYQCLECMEDQNTKGKKFTEKDKICPHCGGKIGKFVCILKARI